MAQYAEFFIGDSIAHRTGAFENSELVFGGAIPREDGGFDIQVVFINRAGYGGMGGTLVWTVREGDRLRLGRGYRAYEDPEHKKRSARIASLYFHRIERDHLTITYDWA